MKLVIIIFIKAYIVLSSIINLVEPDKIIRSTVSQTVQKDINISKKQRVIKKFLKLSEHVRNCQEYHSQAGSQGK